MTTAYAYKSALYCSDCGDRILAKANGHAESLETWQVEDSNWYPQGPFPEGGGEADCPQHCDQCGTFLENPLTPEGVAYVHEAMLRDPGNAIVKQWATHYGYSPNRVIGILEKPVEAVPLQPSAEELFENANRNSPHKVADWKVDLYPYHWLHIPSGKRGITDATFKDRATLDAQLNRWNSQQPGVWVYWHY